MVEKTAAESLKFSSRATSWTVGGLLVLTLVITNNPYVQQQVQESNNRESRKTSRFLNEVRSQQIQQQIIDDDFNAALRRGENVESALLEHQQRTKDRAKDAWNQD